MKRFLTTIVAVVLMLSLCIGCVAEGKPYIRQLGFGSTTYTLMTTESYPMTRIALQSYNTIYHYYDQGADEAVVFPCPEGYYAAKFVMNSAQFYNPDQELNIWYTGYMK
ncbi:MAG: hypothetical protein MJ136_05395 [Clostridia bacterium]|nr:hypothetical protein [Clostridia bacterium]